MKLGIKSNHKNQYPMERAVWFVLYDGLILNLYKVMTRSCIGGTK